MIDKSKYEVSYLGQNYYSSKYLELMYGITSTALHKRAVKLDYTPKRLGGSSRAFYTESQINKILKMGHQNPKHDKRKIQVIEMHLSGMGVNKIASHLKISCRWTGLYIKEFIENGEIIVESNVNYTI